MCTLKCAKKLLVFIGEVVNDVSLRSVLPIVLRVEVFIDDEEAVAAGEMI